MLFELKWAEDKYTEQSYAKEDKIVQIQKTLFCLQQFNCLSK